MISIIKRGDEIVLAIKFSGEPVCDVFLDFTETAFDEISPHIEALVVAEGLSAGEQLVTVTCPMGAVVELQAEFPHFSVHGHPSKALGAALTAASLRRRPLALVQGGWSLRNQTLRSLVEELNHDPMIASVQPRFVSVGGDLLLPFLSGASIQMPVAAASYLPEHYITGEYLSPLIVLAPNAVVGAPLPKSESMLHAYAELLSGLRRRGYRNLLCNRITAPWDGLGAPCGRVLPPLAHEDDELLRSIIVEQPELKLERILSQAFTVQGQPKILIDARGLPSFVNGTAVCVLGFLSGLHAIAQGWLHITVVAGGKEAVAHRLTERYPAFEIHHDTPKGHFVAMTLLNQPWAMSTIREMHERSAIISANILDTILWDIMFISNPGLRKAWSILGQCADILFFNTAYSRDRYCFRFRPKPQMPCVVTHHSMVTEEITHDPGETRIVAERYILIMGNNYDHKEVRNTLRLLSDAFPYLNFVSIGADDPNLASVHAYASGDLSNETIANLYTHAEAVVFPSHYEGFGLPVAEALAYGKYVLVRDMPLWDEIKSISARPDAVLSFQTDSDVVRLLGPIVSGNLTGPVELPSTSLSSQPNWADCARTMLDALEAAMASFNGQHWLIRDDILSQS